MRLDSKQLNILNAVRLNADTEIPAIARRLKVTEKKIRYNLEMFGRSGLITRANFLDVYPLGLRSINLYFTVAATNKLEIEALVHEFVKTPEVTFFSELGGEFHYGAAFALPRFEDVARKLAGMPRSVQTVIVEKHFNAHLALKMYPLRILGAAAEEVCEIGYGEVCESVELDDTGKSLIEMLASRPELSLRETARHVGLSTSATASRVQKLREKRIYRGGWLRINFEALGLHAYKLLVYTRGAGPDFHDKLDRFCSRHRNIDYMIHCVGEWEFEIGLIVESVDQVMGVTRELYDEFGNCISVIKNLPFFRMLKLRQIPEARVVSR